MLKRLERRTFGPQMQLILFVVIKGNDEEEVDDKVRSVQNRMGLPVTHVKKRRHLSESWHTIVRFEEDKVSPLPPPPNIPVRG
jgi:hypothetical protein